MTIKWGDPIECNGVRPDWLRDVADQHTVQAQNNYDTWLPVELNAPLDRWSWSHVAAIRLPADHPAYVALARGFTPWSGGESAPDDWDGGAVLVQDAFGEPNQSRFGPRIQNWSGVEGRARIIGYRKRNTRFDEPHLARIEVEGSAPVDGVFIKRMAPATIVERWTEALSHNGTYEDDVVEFCRRLGLVQDESRAERFTRETGHAVTEAVEAALNWKES